MSIYDRQGRCLFSEDLGRKQVHHGSSFRQLRSESYLAEPFASTHRLVGGKQLCQSGGNEVRTGQQRFAKERSAQQMALDREVAAGSARSMRETAVCVWARESHARRFLLTIDKCDPAPQPHMAEAYRPRQAPWRDGPPIRSGNAARAAGFRQAKSADIRLPDYPARWLAG
jgi:hypothetical protein